VIGGAIFLAEGLSDAVLPWELLARASVGIGTPAAELAGANVPSSTIGSDRPEAAIYKEDP